MDRLTLIQQLIDRHRFKTYLEIGVLGGNNFFPVRCERKIAVDPKFLFNYKGRIGETLRNPSNLFAKFYEVTSDEFFLRHAPPILAKRKIDIALIDGMHEFDYVVRDVLNCLSYLSPQGILVLHDCNPSSAEAAVSFKEWEQRGRTGFWNGDVWKAILFLRRFRKDLNVFVADCDHGLGIVTRASGMARQYTNEQMNEIRLMTYRDLNQNREEFLGLVPESELQKLF